MRKKYKKSKYKGRYNNSGRSRSTLTETRSLLYRILNLIGIVKLNFIHKSIRLRFNYWFVGVITGKK